MDLLPYRETRLPFLCSRLEGSKACTQYGNAISKPVRWTSTPESVVILMICMLLQSLIDASMMALTLRLPPVCSDRGPHVQTSQPNTPRTCQPRACHSSEQPKSLALQQFFHLLLFLFLTLPSRKRFTLAVNPIHFRLLIQCECYTLTSRLHPSFSPILVCLPTFPLPEAEHHLSSSGHQVTLSRHQAIPHSSAT